MNSRSEKQIETVQSLQPPPTLAMDPQLPFIELEEYRFHVRIYGNEHVASIIVLHGGPGADFRYLLPLKRLAKHYRVIFYDQRGTGLSPRCASKKLHLAQYLKDLDAFIEHFKQFGPVSLLGHSWGGHLALQYAAHYPHKINRLLLAEPFIPSAALSYKILMHNLRHGIIPKLMRAIREANRLDVQTDQQAKEDYFFGYLLQQANPGYHCNLETPVLPAWRASYSAFWRLSFSPETKLAEKDMQEINVPTDKMLLLFGACNRLLGNTYRLKLEKQLGWPKSSVIPYAGHYLFSDQPAICIESIIDFMQGQ